MMGNKKFCSSYRLTSLYFMIYIFISNFIHIHCLFNMIDIQKSTIFSFPGNAGSYFGYSIAFVQAEDANREKSILVGAPRSASQYQPSVTRPGALYKCTLSGTNINCVEVSIDITENIEQTINGQHLWHDKDNSWLGVSLDVRTSVAVCAHRWKNQLQIKIPGGDGNLYQNGFCYEMGKILQRPSMIPLEYDDTGNTLFTYGLATMGMSAVYSQSDELLLGAPGINDFSGGLVKITNTGQEKYNGTEEDMDYYGYAVASGFYFGDGVEYIATGGPRDDLTGKVKITNQQYSDVKQVLAGEQVGSYFGAALCTVKIQPNKEILLVGAPFYASTNTQTLSSNTEEGKVYVYIKEGMKLVVRQTLSGSSTKRARFGSAMADIGDINQDTYNDVAIGAPFEDEGKGVVYIYNGYSGMNSIWPEYNQRVTARELGPSLLAFGSSFSRTQMAFNADIYKDIAVGAYMSDSAVLLVPAPPITMEVTPKLSTNIINKADTDFNMTVCFNYDGGKDLPDDVTVEFKINADTERIDQGRPSRVYFQDGSGINRISVTAQNKIFRAYDTTCYDPPFKLVLAPSIVDIITPIMFAVEFKIIATAGDSNAVINRFDGRRVNPTEQKEPGKAEFRKEGCGTDNVCEADLMVEADVSFNFGSESLIIGEKAGFSLDVTIGNQKEPSYDTHVIITFPVYVTYQQYKQLMGDGLTCSPGYNQTSDMNTVECGMTKPFMNGENIKVKVMFDASDATTEEQKFYLDIRVDTRSKEVHSSDNQVLLPVDVTSKADITFVGVSSPEIFVTKDNNEQKWQVLQHRFDLENKGPSPLLMGTMFTFSYPYVASNSKRHLYMNQSLISVTNSNITGIDCGKYTLIKTSGSGNGQTAFRVGKLERKDLAMDVFSQDCTSEGAQCQTITCIVEPIPEQSSVSISLTFMMDSFIFNVYQAKNSKQKSVNIASKLIVDLPSNQRLEMESLQLMASSKTEILPSKPISETFEWWKILLCVLGGIAIIAIIIAICWKFGFFKRKSKEELERKQKEKEEEQKLIQDPGTGNEPTFNRDPNHETTEHLTDFPEATVINENYTGPIDDTVGTDNNEKSKLINEKEPVVESHPVVESQPVVESDIKVNLDNNQPIEKERDENLETDEDIVKMIEDENKKLSMAIGDIENLVEEKDKEK